MSDLMTEIWNNGYDILCETDDHGLWNYLIEQVYNGSITYSDAATMFNDIIDTHNL